MDPLLRFSGVFKKYKGPEQFSQEKSVLLPISIAMGVLLSGLLAIILLESGAHAIYGPGTNIPHAAGEILRLVRRHRKAA